MIDVQKYIIQTMMKKMFENNSTAARMVLGELKTKQKDIMGEITSEVQYKILSKMLKEREESKIIYINNNRFDLANKEREEESVLKDLLAELQSDLPKQLTDDEVRNIIKEQSFANIGDCMKWFKTNYPNQDKKQIARLFNAK